MRGPIAGFRPHVVTFLVAAIVTGGLMLWFMDLGGGLPSMRQTQQVKALLPTAGGMVRGARVTMAGVAVGRVTAVRARGTGAEVDLELNDRRVMPLPRDSRIRLRNRTPVGEAYVEITPGRSTASLGHDDVLPIEQAADTVDVDEILSVLQRPVRQHARALLERSGDALDGRDDELNALVGATASALQRGTRVSAHFADERRALAGLVDDLGRIMRAVGNRGHDIGTLARGARTSLTAIAQRDMRLREVLVALPATLRQVRSTAVTLETVSDDAAPVLAKLATTLDELSPATERLRPAAIRANALIGDLGRTVPALRKTLGEVQRTAPSLVEALPQLGATLCQVNPMLRYIEPYKADLTAGFTNLGGIANAYDASGHTLRGNVVVNGSNLVGLPPSLTEPTNALLHTGFLSQALRLTYDPYPKPGQQGKTKATAANTGVIGPTAVPGTGYVYPRTQADC
ncbi:MAG: MlaD family protein [Solirubrobacteraceae bacterium]